MSINKKLPQDLSAEELVQIALSSQAPLDMGKVTEASKFIYDLQLRPGDAKIPAALIYYTYKCWKGYTADKQPKGQFFQDFKKHFQDYRSNHERYYLLDPRPFDLSEEMRWEYRRDMRLSRARNGKQKE